MRRYVAESTPFGKTPASYICLKNRTPETTLAEFTVGFLPSDHLPPKPSTQKDISYHQPASWSIVCRVPYPYWSGAFVSFLAAARNSSGVAGLAMYSAFSNRSFDSTAYVTYSVTTPMVWPLTSA